MKYGFAGDRQISVNILKFLIGKGYQPSFLLVGENGKSSHAQALIEASGLTADNVFTNKDLNNSDKLSALRAYDVDYIFGIHFPYIIKKALLELPKVGFINLHPAYLPYNKGWHTPSWAILEGTRYGATLHFMSEVSYRVLHELHFKHNRLTSIRFNRRELLSQLFIVFFKFLTIFV